MLLLAHGFRGEAITLRASALTYLTLLSLVPLLAVLYSVVDLVSGEEHLHAKLQGYVNGQLGIGVGALRPGLPADTLRALALVQEGKVYDLDCGRFPGMPVYEGHAPFMVLNYRTGRGIEAQGDHRWWLDPQGTPDASKSEEWIYTCSMPAPVTKAGDPSLVNTVTVSGKDEKGNDVTAQDQHTTAFLHPAVGIAKTGPIPISSGSQPATAMPR